MRQKIKKITEVLSEKENIKIIKETTLKKGQVKCPHCNHIFNYACGYEVVMAHMASEHPSIFFRVLAGHSITPRNTKVTEGSS